MAADGGYLLRRHLRPSARPGVGAADQGLSAQREAEQGVGQANRPEELSQRARACRAQEEYATWKPPVSARRCRTEANPLASGLRPEWSSARSAASTMSARPADSTGRSGGPPARTACSRSKGWLPSGKRGRIVSWKEKLRELQTWKRPCLHSMKQRIAFRACTHDYLCGKCDFDQYFNDQFTVFAVVRQIDVQDIKGIKFPQGYYSASGDTAG
ncbi:MAG: hypothetical protein MZV70_61335 [Desulfobacterales bacterium]|nr:hypothetical protein [Desulfobacterales bacterium]